MALFLSKPILWNSNGYLRPSGVKAYSGFPAEHGFGHEEWNNAPQLAFFEDGVAYRAFHTERVGNADVAAEAGRIFLFLYASHDRVQELVGVAGCATSLIDDEPSRIRLADRLKLDSLADEAWDVQRVRACHDDDRKAFLQSWRHDVAWIPNWICPADTFLWLDTPARLDPQALRGVGKLLTMFGRHTELDQAEALGMLEQVPTGERTPIWHRIRAEIGGSAGDALATDLRDIAARRDIPTTVKQRLIDARVGQAGFRREVEGHWNGACAVSGCVTGAVLRASHIKAWSRSSDLERLDGHNGLLLTAELDALFDRGLLSFDDHGKMLLSARLSKADLALFSLPRPLRKTPSTAQRIYLAEHRRHWALPG